MQWKAGLLCVLPSWKGQEVVFWAFQARSSKARGGGGEKSVLLPELPFRARQGNEAEGCLWYASLLCHAHVKPLPKHEPKFPFLTEIIENFSFWSSLRLPPFPSSEAQRSQASISHMHEQQKRLLRSICSIPGQESWTWPVFHRTVRRNPTPWACSIWRVLPSPTVPKNGNCKKR